MRRNHRLYLEDIFASIEKIQYYIVGLSYESFIKDGLRVDGAVRNLEIIGEAANNLPQEIKDKYPAIEWRKIIDFRNVLVHEYFGIDFDILWDIIQNKLPDLNNQIKIILSEQSQQE